MELNSGYFYCFSCNWNKKNYDAPQMVVIKKDEFEKLIDKFPINGGVDILFNRTFYKLKPEIFQWLEENVPLSKGEKGWCCGSDEYNANAYDNFSIFFQRRKDAMKFIKTWSEYGKPKVTWNQNSRILKKLNPKTNKLEKINRL